MTLVVAVGSFFGDDAIGPQLAECLRQALPRDAEIEVCLSPGTGLLALLDSATPTILIDAAVGAGAPGEVIDIDPERLLQAARPLSSHAMGVAEVLALARSLGRLPRQLAILGIAIDPQTPLREGDRRQAKNTLLTRLRRLPCFATAPSRPDPGGPTPR